MKRIETNQSNKTPLEMMSSYKHLYQKKLQFRFVQCEFDCSVCDFKCTDEDQMQSHISEHSLRDVNAALMKNEKLFGETQWESELKVSSRRIESMKIEIMNKKK